MKAFLLFLSACSLGGVITGYGAKPEVCKTIELYLTEPFPAPVILPGPIKHIPTLYFSAKINFTGDIDRPLNQLMLSKFIVESNINLREIGLVKVSMKGDTPTTPEIPFAEFKSKGDEPGNSIPIYVSVDSDTVIRYMRRPLRFTFAITRISAVQPDLGFLTTKICIIGTLPP